MALLLIDDDRELCELMRRFLAGEGFDLVCCHDGAGGLTALRSQSYELLLLDVMLPGRNGFDILRELRLFSPIPTIMLTARGEELDRVLGLELGADDYLPKPFLPRELAARIRAVLRRSRAGDDGRRRFGTMVWDERGHSVAVDGMLLELTASEYRILTLLMQRAGAVVARAELHRLALGKELGPFDRSLDVHIGHLRRKLPPAASGEPRIRTLRSVGWIFLPE